MFALIATSLSAAPWSVICIVIALVLFALASGVYYFGDPGRRGFLGWLGMFFFALAWALGS